MIGAPVFRYVLTPGWAGDSLARAAQAVPSLDLNFAATKTVGPLVSFTRASSATYIDSAGTLRTAAVDMPRFDHNPTTGESLGLLMEEARTNLALQSNAFTTLWQSVANTLTSGSAISPDGTTNGWRFADTAVSNTHNIFQPIAWTAVATTFTIYAKYDTHQWIGARIGATGNQFFGSWDLQNGVVGSFTAGAIIRMQAVGNGWYRLTLTATLTTAGTANVLVYLNNADSASALTYTGTATGSYIYGAQLEAGAFPTSYIPTTTAAATRSADVASITGANFSSWYRQDEGTVFVDFIRTYSGDFPNYPNVYQFSDGTDNNEITALGNQATQAIQPSIRVSATQQLDFVSRVTNVPRPNRYAHAFAANSSTFAGNATLTATDTSVSLPSVNMLKFGERSGQRFTGCYSRLTYWPQRLSNSTLQVVTQ